LFNLSQSNMNQQLFEKLLCNQHNYYEKYGWFPLQRKIIALPLPNQHFLLLTKMNGTQRRKTQLSPWRMHFMHCSMPKGMSKSQVCVLSYADLKASENSIKWLKFSGNSQLFESSSSRLKFFFGLLILPHRYHHQEILTGF